MSEVSTNVKAAVEGIVARQIKAIPHEVNLIVRHAVWQVGNSYVGPGGQRIGLADDSLYKYVADQFRELTNDFVTEMNVRLNGLAIDGGLKVLSELKPEPSFISGSALVEGENRNEAKVEKESDTAADAVRSNGKVSRVHNGVRYAAPIAQRKIVAFLESNDFEPTGNRTGELVFRHRPTCQRVSIPNHRGDVAAATVRKILLRVGEILQRKLGISKGEIVVVIELPALKGGLD